MTTWKSLYLSSEQSQNLITAVHAFLNTHHYTLYHPFGTLPGMSYPRTIKLFLARPQKGWSRLLVSGDSNTNDIDSLAQHLSKTADCLLVYLEGNVGLIHAFHDDKAMDLVAWARPHLKTSDCDLSALINADSFDLEPLSEGQIGDVPIEALPEDIQEMARQVNIKQANKLFEKLSQRLLQAVGRNQARTMIHQGTQWDSQGGQYIRAVMNCLTIPDNWRTPDFPALRTAYAIQSRIAEGMTTLFPGDDDALKFVPDALEYKPLYGGRIES